MWQAGEIKEDDSGQVVSNKLDAEFSRIQTWGGNVDAQLASYKYTTDVTIFNKSLDKDIVTPYTFWFALDPQIARIDAVELPVGHMEEKLFDGVYWIRSDAMFEYSGAYIPFDSLGDGYMITKAHIADIEDDFDAKYLPKDGSSNMDVGYEPTNDLDVTTKEYVDTVKAELESKIGSRVIEYPASSAGDTLFTAALAGKEFAVYKNGIYQRRVKYSYNDSSFSFTAPLDAGDEISVVILGDA